MPPLDPQMPHIRSAIAQRILSKDYGVGGARLPSERQLAASLSGATIQPAREWGVGVTGAYAQHLVAQQDLGRGAQMWVDMLSLRRALMVDLVGLAAGRVQAADLAQARVALQRAWDLRAQPAAFVAADLDMHRALLEAAQLLPALWVLNSQASMYVSVASAALSQVAIPEDYLSTFGAVFDAIEGGRSDVARTLTSEYLLRYDRALAGQLSHTLSQVPHGPA